MASFAHNFIKSIEIFKTHIPTFSFVCLLTRRISVICHERYFLLLFIHLFDERRQETMGQPYDKNFVIQESSKNDDKQFWTILDIFGQSSPTDTVFNTRALVLSSQNHWPHLFKAVVPFKDDLTLILTFVFP